MQDSPPSLTYNGVLYLTLGFKQHYLLQVLSLQQHQKDLHLVLYDGLVYIGALYRPSPFALREPDNPQNQSSSLCQPSEQVRMFDVVKIYPRSVCSNEPIVLQKLEVVASNLSCELGKQIITLEQFMRRRRFINKPVIDDLDEEEEQVVSPHSRKITKLMEEASFEKSNTKESEVKSENLMSQHEKMNEEHAIVIEDSNPEAERIEMDQKETQKMVIEPNVVASHTEETVPLEIHMSSQKQPMEKEEMPQEIQIVDQTNTQRNLRPQEKVSIVLDLEEEEFTLNNKNNVSASYSQSQVSAPTPKVSKVQKNDSILRITDLYQRMHRFRILCRINYISEFISQKGTHCTKLLLIDESGDEIICMLYQKTPHINNTQPKFIKGKSYIFENGEVMKEEGELSISVPLNGIIQQHLFLPSFVPSKMKRLGDVRNQKSSNEYMKKAINLQDKPSSKKEQLINVCGIFQGFKGDPKTIKNHFKVIGILCDPELQLSIHFSLLVDELASFPSPGSPVSLHNMVVSEDEHTITLEGNKKSYILNETGNAHNYFSDLLKSSQGDWKLHEYRNLSLVTYTGRTINELRQLLGRVGQHEYIYSQIDCSIACIKEKRSFTACIACKKEVKAQSNPFSYCYNCKKTNKHIPYFSFDLELSDPTGSLSTILFSDNLQGYIGTTTEQYIEFGVEDRAMFLEFCTYRNIMVKMRSERVVGAVIHKPISACQSSHKRSLDQIRSMSIEQKTKFVNHW